MKILNLKLENHPILWNLELDFTDSEWNPVDTIIIWWENGTWKSTILNIIYNLWNRYAFKLKKDEKIIFWILLNEDELKLFHDRELLTSYSWKTKIFITFFLDNIGDINYKLSVDSYNNTTEHHYLIFHPGYRIHKIFNSIYSDVWIDYNSKEKTMVTSKTLDNDINESIKSSTDLADEITQLFIDINAQDAQDFQNYYIVNWEKGLEEQVSKRMKRFKNAFNFIFENKKFKEIKNISNWKEVIFEENGKECNINQLSSWEKQIVFRWGFLLQNKNSINGNPILIDEPEISLHPNWQLKILDFYKNIFIDESWIQSSQIFIVTHSPFILHNPNRINDKVITLSKENWIIKVDDTPKFFGYTDIEEFVSKSFSLPNGNKPIVLVEDEYDQIYKIAYLKLKWIECEESNLDDFFEKNSDFEIYSWCSAWWVAGFLRTKTKKMYKQIIIWLFDFDKEWRENFFNLSKDEFWKEDVWWKQGEKVYWTKEDGIYKKRIDENSFFAMLLPIPDRLKEFANNKWSNFVSYVEIENLLPEDFLKNNNFISEKEEACGTILKIKDNVKKDLWKKLFDLQKEDFKDFKPLFKQIYELFWLEDKEWYFNS